jgi:hypothetical protein
VDIICGDRDVADSWFLQIFFIARIVMIFHYDKVQGSLTAYFHAYIIPVDRDILSCLSFPTYYSKQFLILPSLSLVHEKKTKDEWT